MSEYIVVDGEKWPPVFYRDVWLYQPHLAGRASFAISTSGRSSQDFEEALCLMRLNNSPGERSITK